MFVYSQGIYIRKKSKRINYSQTQLKTNTITQNGKPVFLAEHIWKPDEDELLELIRYGVNGIFTDFPEMVWKMRRK